jgi:hypothetical protein
MFHHRLFENRNFPIALLGVFCEGITFYCANNYFAFEVSMFYTTDSLTIGLHYSIAFYAFFIFAILTGVYSWKTKSLRLPTCVAFGCFLVFNILMATTNPRTPEANIWAYPLFLGAGLGIALTALMVAAQFSTPPELIAITSGLMISMRSLGGTVGLAIYNAIFNAALTQNLASKIAAATLPLGLPETFLGPLIGALAANNATALAGIPGATPSIVGAGAEALLDAFAVAFRNVWIAAGAFALLALIGKYIVPNFHPCHTIWCTGTSDVRCSFQRRYSCWIHGRTSITTSMRPPRSTFWSRPMSLSFSMLPTLARPKSNCKALHVDFRHQIQCII